MWIALLISTAMAQDIDGDGFPDASDNCPADANDQTDNDGDGQGLACDCDDGDPSVLSWYMDADADGWGGATFICGSGGPGLAIRSGDCNDSDPSISPSAPEIPDGRDNDCDGLVDESSVTDDDGDGYDSTADCDDTDPSIHPDAIEVSGDGVDSNCDTRDGSTLLTVFGPIAGQYGYQISGGSSNGTGLVLAGTTPGPFTAAVPGCGIATFPMVVDLAAPLTLDAAGTGTLIAPAGPAGLTIGVVGFDLDGCGQTQPQVVTF